jgi:protein SCO1/2
MKKSYLKALGVATVIAGGVTVWMAFSVSQKLGFSSRGPLPIYGKIEKLQLVDQEGKAFTSANLKDSVHVVNFIFTSCPSVCPTLTRQMKQIQERSEKLSPVIKLVSISVDPENDTPKRLKEYAKHYGADLTRWSFLTGPLPAVKETVIKEFMTGMEKSTGKKEPPGELTDISHGAHFALLDRRGQIRAFRHAETNHEINELLTIASQLNQAPLSE